jgi:glycosyltransferase involved in cell wall biosynthesis
MSHTSQAPGTGERPRVDVVIPVLNEAHVLEKSVDTLTRFLQSQPGFRWRIVIVDNGSTDGTDRVARALAATRPDVAFLHLEQGASRTRPAGGA